MCLQIKAKVLFSSWNDHNYLPGDSQNSGYVTFFTLFLYKKMHLVSNFAGYAIPVCFPCKGHKAWEMRGYNHSLGKINSKCFSVLHFWEFTIKIVNPRSQVRKFQVYTYTNFGLIFLDKVFRKLHWFDICIHMYFFK